MRHHEQRRGVRRVSRVLPDYLGYRNAGRSKSFDDTGLAQNVAVGYRLDARRRNLDHHLPPKTRTTEGEAGRTAGEWGDVGDLSRGESPTQRVEIDLGHSADRFRPADFGQERLGVGNAPGQGLRITR